MIAVNSPLLGDRAIANVAECVRTGWISSAGPFVDDFEQRWAAQCQRRHGVAVANGTVALELALRTLHLRPGDEVILPTFTIISCVMAVVYAGGTPVLVDADPDTWTMDVEQMQAKVTARTRAIMPVHIYGHPVDMDPVIAVGQARGLHIVEDAAEAHGAMYRGRPCGSFGDLSCFSFYANKIVTTGEGGMVLTDSAALADELRSLRNLCFGREERFRHAQLGYNYRLTNLQAAVGVAQLDQFDALIERKRRMAARYTERLASIAGLQLPVERSWATNVYWMYGIVLSPELGRDARAVAAQLTEHGIETRPFFLGMHEQPALRERGLFEGEQYPVAERLSRFGFYLPSGLGLTDGDQDAVCAAMRTVLA